MVTMCRMPMRAVLMIGERLNMKRDYLIPAGIFFLSLFLFTWGLNAQEITGFDSRFYLFAKEMLQNGMSWFPTTYYQPYPDYPVTSTVLIYLGAKIFGGLNKLIAVLPSAIAAAWTVVLTYRIGTLRDRHWGLVAVCFMLMTLMFLKCARAISLDMYIAMTSAWCFYLIYSADLQNKRATMGVYLLLALSFAFRGPIGLVMPAGVVCSYYFIDRQWKKLIVFGLGALAVLAVSTAILFYLAYHAAGVAFMQDVIRMQVAGRIDNAYQPIYFYFTNSIGNYAISYPLALFSIILVLLGMRTASSPDSRFRREDVALLLKLLGWALIIIVGMTIPGDKKSRYILPMVPAIALIAAYPFAQKIRKLKQLWVLAIITLVLDVFYIQFIERYFSAYDKTAQFVQAIEDMRAKAHAKLVFYREQSDGTPIKYQVYNQQGDVPVFLATEGELLNYKQPAFFVTSEDYFASLPEPVLSYFNIIARGKVGHVMMVMFVRK